MLERLEHFSQKLKVEKNYSDNTINSYLYDLRSFENYLNKRKFSFKKAFKDQSVFKNYFRLLTRKKLSPKTIKRKYSSLSTYINFLIDMKIIKMNPLYGIHTPKLSKKLPSVLTLDEIKKIFKEAENTDNELLGFSLKHIILRKNQPIYYSNRLF